MKTISDEQLKQISGGIFVHPLYPTRNIYSAVGGATYVAAKKGGYSDIVAFGLSVGAVGIALAACTFSALLVEDHFPGVFFGNPHNLTLA